MPVKTLISAAVSDFFRNNAASFKQGGTDVPNDSKMWAAKFPDEQGRLKEIAEALGIDYEATKTTYRVSNKAGKVAVYDLLVANKKGVPCLQWGAVNQPLADVSGQPGVILEVEEKDKKTYLHVSVDALDADFYVSFSFKTELDAQGKKVYPDSSDVKKAFRKGNLADFLEEGITVTQGSLGKAVESGILDLGSYQIVSYQESRFKSDKGETKFKVLLKDYGWFDANTTVNVALAGRPDLSEDSPAALNLLESGTTSSGQPYVKTEVCLPETEDAGLFDW